MSIITELFVASDEKAGSHRVDAGKGASGARFGGLHGFHFALMWSQLAGKPFDPAVHFPVAVDGCVELFCFPEPFVALLTGLKTEAQQFTLAKRWGEMEGVGVAPAQAQPVVEALVKLARLSLKRGLHLYLRVS